MLCMYITWTFTNHASILYDIAMLAAIAAGVLPTLSMARIMARSLNCEQGPTSTPCGVCDSCVSLAPGGPGNLDVTELTHVLNTVV